MASSVAELNMPLRVSYRFQSWGIGKESWVKEIAPRNALFSANVRDSNKIPQDPRAQQLLPLDVSKINALCRQAYDILNSNGGIAMRDVAQYTDTTLSMPVDSTPGVVNGYVNDHSLPDCRINAICKQKHVKLGYYKSFTTPQLVNENVNLIGVVDQQNDPKTGGPTRPVAVVVGGVTDIFNIFGEKAQVGEYVGYIIKRVAVNTATATINPVMVVPYHGVLLPSLHDLTYKDLSGTWERGCYLHLGMITDVPDQFYNEDAVNAIVGGDSEEAYRASMMRSMPRLTVSLTNTHMRMLR